jgi:RNA polymerase sigma factor (sigma-70 family)
MQKNLSALEVQDIVKLFIQNGRDVQSKDFNKLMDIMYPKIKRHVNTYIYNTSKLDDFTSDIIELIINNIHTYNESYFFVTWCFSIARHHIFRMYKKYEIINETIGHIHYKNEYYSYSDSYSECLNVNNNKFNLVYNTIMESSGDKIDSFMYIHKELNDIPLKDIAECYNVSINTVKTKVYKVRDLVNNKLKKCKHLN